jgi:hypothetical protein
MPDITGELYTIETNALGGDVLGSIYNALLKIDNFIGPVDPETPDVVATVLRTAELMGLIEGIEELDIDSYNITEELDIIKNSRYGSEIRMAIHDALDKLNYAAEHQHPEPTPGGGPMVSTGIAVFDLATTGAVGTVTETPPTVHITCDTGYYFDSAVTCTLNGNQRQKSNSTPAVGVIAHFFGYCDPIFISPLSAGVLCTVGNDTVPANRTLVHGGIAWYWSTVNNGVGGSYDDTEGNMLTYPGSINSDDYSAEGSISPTYIRQILEYVHASAWEEF